MLGDPVPTLLHISDLHRTSAPRIDNDELLPAILSDTKRWEEEGIPYPEVIVVSGDLIQGTSVDHPNPDSEIASQYAEVEAFLQQLTSEMVDSDPSRVIIVPGNHDVHWSRALQALSAVACSRAHGLDMAARVQPHCRGGRRRGDLPWAAGRIRLRATGQQEVGSPGNGSARWRYGRGTSGRP